MVVLKNGKVSELEEGLEVVDDNVVRPQGMTRYASENPTAFQKLLDRIIANKFKLKGNESELVFNMPSMQQPASMFSSNDETILDAYNDTRRRFFESILAKKIIGAMPIATTQLGHLVSDMKHFFESYYCQHYIKYGDNWKKAQQGIKADKDSLAYFSVLLPELRALTAEKHFAIAGYEDSVSDAKHKLIIDLYCLHYGTHGLPRSKQYWTLYPHGLIEIYNEDKWYFRRANRGGIRNYGFNKDSPSSYLGLFRSCDGGVPMDIRKEIPLAMRKQIKEPYFAIDTRCPDRLYMEHPKSARQNKQNFQHYSFANKYNSCYVNGLSGSMLLEIRAVLFYLLAIKEKRHQVSNPTLLKAIQSTGVFKQYFLLMASLFVYFEGGHTFSEIFSVFGIDEVRQMVDDVVFSGIKQNKCLATKIKQSDFFIQCANEALIETAKYHQVVQVHKEACSLIKRHAEKAIASSKLAKSGATEASRGKEPKERVGENKSTLFYKPAVNSKAASAANDGLWQNKSKSVRQ